jgi:DNA replication protein DnaC
VNQGGIGHFGSAHRGDPDTEWVILFDDQILANSALDRLAHNAHQMIIEGESYRKKKGTSGSRL